tara:strand:- start:3139 stop:4437 length:1299 start_codon:yes stop_codon:yes gene_type:complete
MRIPFLIIILLISIFSFGQYIGTNQVINNGNMRFGNGTELSINLSGNLKQPFYFSVLQNSWRKLTYSEPSPIVNYPLDSKWGFGGLGTSNWNTNGTLVSNPTMTNQVFDTSGFNIISGSGVIKVKGKITSGLSVLEVINSYDIGANNNFVEITTMAKNIGFNSVSNIRYWIGTRDDYVGGTDLPTKVRGNLVNGAFLALTSENQRASALRITTSDEGILFYTTSNRGNNVHSNYDDKTNPSTLLNPISAIISATNDGSYSMYVRMNDLAVGQSDSFIWYYAAAALDELEELFSDVSDEVVPIVIPDTDLDGILDPYDDCPNAAGIDVLSGCPWPFFISNNYKSSITSDTIQISNEDYLCSLTNSIFYNIAHHSGVSAEPIIGDFIIYNNNYSFPHNILFNTQGYALFKLRDYDKLVEIRQIDGKITSIYSCP